MTNKTADFNPLTMYRTWRDALGYGSCIMELYEDADSHKTMLRFVWFPVAIEPGYPMAEYCLDVKLADEWPAELPLKIAEEMRTGYERTNHPRQG